MTCLEIENDFDVILLKDFDFFFISNSIAFKKSKET